MGGSSVGEKGYLEKCFCGLSHGVWPRSLRWSKTKLESSFNYFRLPDSACLTEVLAETGWCGCIQVTNGVFHQAWTQTACHPPTCRVLLYGFCCSVTWVFQNSSDLENMATVGTRSPCSLDSTPLFGGPQGLSKQSVHVHCTGEG